MKSCGATGGGCQSEGGASEEQELGGAFPQWCSFRCRRCEFSTLQILQALCKRGRGQTLLCLDPQGPRIYSHPGTFKLEALESLWSSALSLELGTPITPLPIRTVANLEF